MKIIIHKEVEVTSCSNCPFNKTQNDGVRGESWKECFMPYCVLTGNPKRLDLLYDFLKKHGPDGFNKMYKDSGLSCSSIMCTYSFDIKDKDGKETSQNYKVYGVSKKELI